MQRFTRLIQDFSIDIYTLMCGALFSLFAILDPIKHIVHFVLLLFIIDVALGYWNAHKNRGERFKVKKIWDTTVPRMTISILLILITYGWDEVFGQNVVSAHKVAGWFISGMLIFSIGENGYDVTKWNVFS